MQKVIAYKTRDRVLHHTYKDAKEHADKLYGDALTKAAHQLAKLDGKYTKFVDFLDKNAGIFSQLVILKSDANIVEDETDFETDD